MADFGSAMQGSRFIVITSRQVVLVRSLRPRGRSDWVARYRGFGSSKPRVVVLINGVGYGG